MRIDPELGEYWADQESRDEAGRDQLDPAEIRCLHNRVSRLLEFDDLIRMHGRFSSEVSDFAQKHSDNFSIQWLYGLIESDRQLLTARLRQRDVVRWFSLLMCVAIPVAVGIVSFVVWLVRG